MHHGRVKQVGDELDLEGGALFLALIAAAGKEVRQMIRQSLDRAVVEQHPAERTEPALGADALPQFAEQGRGDLG